MLFNFSSRILLRRFNTTSVMTKMDIKTFVFLDSETTGLPSHEYNKTRMTELCFTAVQSDHIRLGTFPRIQNKINLCFNPMKFINPFATDVSGLSNELLEYQSQFNNTTFSIIQNFLSLQPGPICFVAHNGNRFDYPILKAELHKTGNELSEDILCVDSLIAFREINTIDVEKLCNGEAGSSKETLEVPLEFQDGFDELLCNLADNLESSGEIKKMSVEEIQKINETTPQKNKSSNTPGTSKTNKVIKRQLPFGKPSFKLCDVYTRLTSKEPINAHRAEYDVSMLIECAAILGERFVDWSNQHCIKFCDIPMMTPGKYIGT